VEDVYVERLFGAGVPSDVRIDPVWIQLAKDDPAEFLERLSAARGDPAPNAEQNIVAQVPTMSVDLLLALRRAELDSSSPRDAVLNAIALRLRASD
jgi:hypothetical protein